MLWSLLVDMGKTDQEKLARARSERLGTADDHYLPVAVKAGRLVGYAWAQDFGEHLRGADRTARLHDLYSHPNERRRGVGSALFRAVKAWSDERGVKWLQWQASLDAVPFYRALGLAGDPCPDPEHPFFELMRGEDARGPLGDVPRSGHQSES